MNVIERLNCGLAFWSRREIGFKLLTLNGSPLWCEVASFCWLLLAIQRVFFYVTMIQCGVNTVLELMEA